MSYEKLKAATSLHDVASLLGYQPKKLAYILYKKDPEKKYTKFEIAKRNGGVRLISAPYPDLMTLQRRLADLLQDCIEEINKTRKVRSAISHGFRRKHSILTNAAAHRNRRYVFNTDLQNFFGSINFGRVRGFFIINKNFRLTKEAPTVIAQIACHDNALPQGSPCSPVISNLIGHLLDIRLARLAYRTGCTYSRYADDLTFSTNNRNFSSEIAVVDNKTHLWNVGRHLTRLVQKTGFEINSEKTRMQYRGSRQDVTGLVVNSKVNCRVEYRRTARAMVDRLFKTGDYQRKQIIREENGKITITETSGTLNELNGMLSFIHSVDKYNLEKNMAPQELKKHFQPAGNLSSTEKTYRRFLLYKFFYANPLPLIVCEGKTDNIYLEIAIRRLIDDAPLLAVRTSDKKIERKVAILKRTTTLGRVLGLTGGASEITNLMHQYLYECKDCFKRPEKINPVIFLIDNDKGAADIFSYAKKHTSPVTKDMPLIHLAENLYIVPTPRLDGADTMIEDLFEPAVRDIKLNGKTFNPSNKKINQKTEYSKAHFAEHVIKKNANDINFDGFKTLLKTLERVIVEHKKK